MNFDKLVKYVLENSTVASVGMPSSGTVFSGDEVWAPGETRKAGLIGGGKIIRRNKPELITTDLFKGIKKINKKPKKHKKRR
jgi:hypothetical protein